MCRILDQLADHGLDHTNIAIQHTANETAGKGKPEARGKSDD